DQVAVAEGQADGLYVWSFEIVETSRLGHARYFFGGAVGEREVAFLCLGLVERVFPLPLEVDRIQQQQHVGRVDPVNDFGNFVVSLFGGPAVDSGQRARMTKIQVRD